MKNIFSLIVLASVSFSAQAEFYKYECSLVADFDDWSVRVGNTQADFFDNNSNCILSRQVGSRSALYLSTFDCGPEPIRFVFDVETLTAALHIAEGVESDEGIIKDFAMTCKEGAYQD